MQHLAAPSALETAASQSIALPTKAEPTPVSEATTLTTAPSDPELETAVARPISKQTVMPSGAVIEEVQAFRAPTPELPALARSAAPSASAPRSLPPLTQQAPQQKPEMTEVNRFLQMNESISKGDAVVLMDEIPQTPPQRQPGLPAQERTGPSRGTSSSLAPQATGVSDRDEQQQQQQAAGPAPAAADDDPWASLQAAYQIGHRSSGSVTAAGASSKRPGGKGRGGEDEDEDDVVVLDEGRPGSSAGLAPPPRVSGAGRGGLAAEGRPSLPPAKVSVGQPRAGGWGNGELAAAGTLMLEDEPTSAPSRTSLAPVSGRGRSSAAAVERSAPSEDEGLALEAGGMVGGGHADDLGMEDVEDVDALIEAEMASSGLNAGLASKLAKFEAMMDDD